MSMSKGLSRRRDTRVGTTIYTLSTELQRGQEECKASCEWSKGRAYDELYDRLGTKECEKDTLGENHRALL
jgi:hypothetical protein